MCILHAFTPEIKITYLFKVMAMLMRMYIYLLVMFEWSWKNFSMLWNIIAEMGILGLFILLDIFQYFPVNVTLFMNFPSQSFTGDTSLLCCFCTLLTCYFLQCCQFLSFSWIDCNDQVFFFHFFKISYIILIGFHGCVMLLINL